MSQYVDQRMQAWIGRTLIDRSGQRIGRVEDIYTDDVGGHPAWLAVATGRFGLNIIFLPFAGAVPAGGDELRVQFPKSLVRDAPIAGKGGRLTQDEVVRLYDHYGFDLEAEEVRERTKYDAPSPRTSRSSASMSIFSDEMSTSPRAPEPAAPQAVRPEVPPARPQAPPVPQPVAPQPLRPPVPTAAQGERPRPPRPEPRRATQAAARPAARPLTPLAARLAAADASGLRPDSPLLWNHDDRIDSIRPPREPAQTGRR